MHITETARTSKTPCILQCAHTLFHMPLSCATKEGVGSGRLLMGGSLPGDEEIEEPLRKGGGEYLRKSNEKFTRRTAHAAACDTTLT